MPITCVFTNTVLAQRWTRKKKDKERMALHYNFPVRVSHRSPASCSLFPHCSSCRCLTAVLCRGSSDSVYKDFFSVWSSASPALRAVPWVGLEVEMELQCREEQPGWKLMQSGFAPEKWCCGGVGEYGPEGKWVHFFRIVNKIKEVYKFQLWFNIFFLFSDF